MCGENVADQSLYWKCMEAGDIYPSSLIVLNKNTFELQIGAVLIGMDVWKSGCFPGSFSPANNTNCPAFVGPDGDMSAVSSYYDKNNFSKAP